MSIQCWSLGVSQTRMLCMVVLQPLSWQQMRDRGKTHVHFFDELLTRGWVSTKYIREYHDHSLPLLSTLQDATPSPVHMDIYGLSIIGSDSSDAMTGGVFFSSKPVIRRAMMLADAAMPDSPEIRLKMPVCMDPSDAEEEKDMELDKSRLTDEDLNEERDEKGTVKSV
uniref:Uncharacterized protein n=1 Tax=Hucho hucho TaxID=62062 RepID=A0A4W5M1G9_9TELE